MCTVIVCRVSNNRWQASRLWKCRLRYLSPPLPHEHNGGDNMHNGGDIFRLIYLLNVTVTYLFYWCVSGTLCHSRKAIKTSKQDVVSGHFICCMCFDLDVMQCGLRTWLQNDIQTCVIWIPDSRYLHFLF